MPISQPVELINYFDSWVRNASLIGPVMFSNLKMGLPREYVHYLSRRVVEELIKREMIEVKDTPFLQGIVDAVPLEELSVEDRINEEVRSILKDYAEEMRRTGVSYQEMFKIVKNKLVKDKKVIL
jgi:hypothetical protein